MGKTSKTKSGPPGSRTTTAETKKSRSKSGKQAAPGNQATQQMLRERLEAEQGAKPVAQKGQIVRLEGFEGEFYGPFKHARGFWGEVNAAHALGRKYGIENVIIAPKDWVNQGGIDLVVYDPVNDKVLFIDNKATKSTHIDDATALTKNLAQNTEAAKGHIENMPHIDPALKKKVLSAINEKRIGLRISTELGNGATLGQKLISAGVTFENLDPASLGAGRTPSTGMAAAADQAAPARRQPITVTRPEPEGLAERIKPQASFASESSLYEGDFGNTRTAVAGPVLDTILGGAQNLFNDKYKDYMKKELNNMPMPKVDRRLASRYFIDPKSSEVFNVLDLFNKDLPGFGRSFKDKHTAIVSDAYMDAYKVGLGKASDENRLFDLESAQLRLEDHVARLNTILANLDAALEMEVKALEAAEAAEALQGIIHTYQGQIASYGEIKPDDISLMQSNLRLYARLIREGYQNVKDLKATVEPLLEEAILTLNLVNRLYWSEAFGQAKKKTDRGEPLETE